MWSKLKPDSENDTNYLVDDIFKEPICSPTNIIWVLELTFELENSNQTEKIAPFSYYIGIFKDAKRVLSEKEIIDEVHKFKAPLARLVDKKSYKIF